MEKTENLKDKNQQGKRPGGNNLTTPAKPPSEDLIAAMSDLNIIVLITVVGNYLRIYYYGKSYKDVKGTLKSAWELCLQSTLMKTHKSYILNLRFVIKFTCVFENYETEMTNGKTGIVGRFYKDEFNERIKPYLKITRRKKK